MDRRKFILKYCTNKVTNIHKYIDNEKDRS